MLSKGKSVRENNTTQHGNSESETETIGYTQFVAFGGLVVIVLSIGPQGLRVKMRPRTMDF
jgi:hypothetical protein